MTPLPESGRPRLARHARLRFDETRARWTLLAPERLLLPDDTALEILRCCDGATALREILDGLAAEYDAPREAIAADVLPLLSDLLDKGFLVMEEGDDAAS